MWWKDIFFRMRDLLADPYLAAHQDDFSRWMLAKIMAHPAAGDAKLARENDDKGLPPAIDLGALAAEYRQVKGILTHEEHSRQVAEKQMLERWKSQR